MKILILLILAVSFACNSKPVFNEVVRTEKIDPDIILINIGNGNRTEIATLLNDIANCSPSIIGIDVFFSEHKKSLEDSILTTAIKNVPNDILAYRFDATGKEERSINEFRRFASDEGHVNIIMREEVSSHFQPIKKVNGNIYESFALKIIKRWKPGFKYNIAVDETIPILFQRSQKQYHYFEKMDLLDTTVCELLKDKIVLVGFLGPGDEDKHFSPIRSNDKEIKPDMYGIVIQANAIRTILRYEKKD